MADLPLPLDAVIEAVFRHGPRRDPQSTVLRALLTGAGLETERYPDAGWDAGERLFAVRYGKLQDGMGWPADKVDRTLSKLAAKGWIGLHTVHGVVDLAPAERLARTLEHCSSKTESDAILETAQRQRNLRTHARRWKAEMPTGRVPQDDDLEDRAADVFRSSAKARIWLTTPLGIIGKQSPNQLASTSNGRRTVEKILAKIEWGGAA